ncbi:MAG TPA: GNAT family N-acetyltransferase [Steroidobacteraceae bacterium]|nr:GNAT family N-acetyltransferase [Steroidobacteraceae bacterium]
MSRLDVMPSELLASCEQTALFHQRIGYEPPWVSYIAAEAGCGVGGGAFVGAPREGVVEIAYFTLPQFEGRGYATQTARALVDIARQAKPHIILKAFTLPQANASTRILERLGFKQIGWAQDADAGAVWEWRTS